MMDLPYIRIEEKDYETLRSLFAKGVRIPMDGIDYAKAYGMLVLLHDLDVPTDRIFLGGGLESASNPRDLMPEMPYRVVLNSLGITFTVKKPEKEGRTSLYAEVRCDYFDDEEGVWCVDAWLTDDDDEEGIVVAKIDGHTGEVTYLKPEARYDAYVQEVIKETLDDGYVLTE